MTEVGQGSRENEQQEDRWPVIGIGDSLTEARRSGVLLSRRREPRRAHQRRIWIVGLLVMLLLLAAAAFLVYHYAIASDTPPVDSPAAASTCAANLAEMNAGADAFKLAAGMDPASLDELVDANIVKIPRCPAGGTYGLMTVMTAAGPGLRAVCSVHGSEEQARQKAGLVSMGR